MIAMRFPVERKQGRHQTSNASIPQILSPTTVVPAPMQPLDRRLDDRELTIRSVHLA